MYEQHHVEPIPAGKFVLRILGHSLIALAIITFSLLIGMAGYRFFEHMTWLDAFLNASMLLGGMGPVKTQGLSSQGKLFAGLYALYAGMMFITVMGIMLAPVVHRVMHLFHWAEEK
jgi:hypothetical protein